MKRTIYNHYDIDDIKKMILDALQSYGAASKNDIQTFKDYFSKQMKDLNEKHLHLAQPEYKFYAHRV